MAVRLIFLSDFTEAFPHSLLQGILNYARERAAEPWVVCRMPPSYKEQNGIEGVVEWAKNWKANAIIGRFLKTDDVALFGRNGITAVAQDFKEKRADIPNITSDYRQTGRMAAEFFLQRGFRSFAFCGYKDTVWSDERCEGYREAISEAGFGDAFQTYINQPLETLWYYDSTDLADWLRQLPPHTALFCCDDNQGNKITEACKVSGISIPSDIAVLGVDNDTMMCELSDPPLSSIDLDIEQGGYDTARLITHLMEHPDSDYRDVVIRATAVVSRASTNTFATDDDYIRQAMSYIHDHMREPIAVDDLVDLLPLSRRLLEIRFKTITGTSIYSYILQTRIDLFARLLTESGRPIKEIAFDMGFNNYGNLSRQFRLFKGCSPKEYRQQHQSSH